MNLRIFRGNDGENEPQPQIPGELSELGTLYRLLSLRRISRDNAEQRLRAIASSAPESFQEAVQSIRAEISALLAKMQ